MRQSLLTAAGSTETAIRRVAHGLEWADAEFLAKALDVTLDRLADLTGITRSTFSGARRKGVFLSPNRST